MNQEHPLSGPWLVRHDPENRGFTDRWWEAPPEDGWVSMDPVGPWQRVLGENATGVGWYRRTLPIVETESRTAAGKVWLRFESVATECIVWVAGREVGRHIGDYVAFEIDATEALRGATEPIELVVRVDQHHAPRPAPGVLTENGYLTKGFHDVLSIQHAGIWCPVSVRQTGDWSIPPGGIRIDADPNDGTVGVEIEVRSGATSAEIRLDVFGAKPGVDTSTDSGIVTQVRLSAEPGVTSVRTKLRVLDAQRWSPEAPRLYTLRVEIGGASAGGELSESVSDRAIRTFGFRDVRTGGPGNRRILINGRPTLIRGVLEWGHEPDHISPSPTFEECRERIRELKARGFNCICCCMVYMPEQFYEAADIEGMLIWQQHPVWKSRMGPEHNAEYQRQFERFFRRDAAHPSVVIVSGSCEHEAFDKELAAWWWRSAGERLPRTLKQVQTAFFAWADPTQTDLYDEHTYDNSGRWVEYVKDVRAAIDALADPRKPFIMGETILSNAWPTREAMTANQRRPAWWRTKGLDACLQVEMWIEKSHGSDALARFRRQAHQHALGLRKFQSEILRMDADTAGWVMNHIRDVPLCRCGFIDENGRWRYSADELAPFLGDVALLMRTPGETRGFAAGERVPLHIGVSNFSSREIRSGVRIEGDGNPGEAGIAHALSPRAAAGEVGWTDLILWSMGIMGSMGSTRSERVNAVPVRATAGDGAHNAWRLWTFPRRDLPACVWADAPAFTGAERKASFEELGYSNGWGLPVRSWSARMPESQYLLPGVPVAALDSPSPQARPAVMHRLTERTLRWIESGGRAVLLASHAAGGFRAKIAMQWSLLPFIAEAGPLGAADSEWIVDLLHHDLTKRFQRAVPTEELGIAASISPLIRYYSTHDSGTPRVLDAVFAVRVGSGILAVSSLDHGETAGEYLLSAMVAWLSDEAAGVTHELSAEALRAYTYESERQE